MKQSASKKENKRLGRKRTSSHEFRDGFEDVLKSYRSDIHGGGTSYSNAGLFPCVVCRFGDGVRPAFEVGDRPSVVWEFCIPRVVTYGSLNEVVIVSLYRSKVFVGTAGT